MAGQILDGKKISVEILAELRSRIAALPRPPALAVVLVGENPASQIYVRNKIKACHDLGIRSIELRPSGDISTQSLIDELTPLANDRTIDGILVQMPLPPQIDSERVTSFVVDPSRDVDGFSPPSLGLLVANKPGPRACTPAGVMEILKRYQIPIAGKHAVVVGRSDIVGKPMALMLLHENATVTICHSRTPDLAAQCKQADILVAAIGRPAFLNEQHIKPGAVVVDVGMNRLTAANTVQSLFAFHSARLAAFAKNGSVLVGDVDPRAMQELSSFYTPVPGGVGPLTIAMLMSNTVQLAEQHA
jgi:methylenetetrahydrofolate dehydrogenase (NADP+)/methenyltetrahydrofolate cyclohydrolase